MKRSPLPLIAAVAATLLGTPAGASAAVDLRVNFQPGGVPVPSGFVADTGAPFEAGRGWVREDSLGAGEHVPLDVRANTRDRERLDDQLLDTLVHLQYPASVANDTAQRMPAAWELAVPDGAYDVSVAVGDPVHSDSVHVVNVEGQTVIEAFEPTAETPSRRVSRTVDVTDGRLTIDARGGTNTKLQYVTVDTADARARPSVRSTTPEDGASGVPTSTAVTAEVRLPNIGSGIDPATLDGVRLHRVGMARSCRRASTRAVAGTCWSSSPSSRWSRSRHTGSR